jgi:hypothetical protein
MCKDGQTVSSSFPISGNTLFFICLALLIILVVYIAFQKGLFNLEPLRKFIQQKPQVLMLQPKNPPEVNTQTGGAAIASAMTAISTWV